ncbi:MAG: hypothetical protein ACTS4T_00565 [Candidatus Hodgkinia cicadicola]
MFQVTLTNLKTNVNAEVIRSLGKPSNDQSFITLNDLNNLPWVINRSNGSKRLNFTRGEVTTSKVKR